MRANSRLHLGVMISVLFLASGFWTIPASTRETPTSEFRFLVSGDVNGTLEGKPSGVTGLVGRGKYKGQCMVSIVLPRLEARSGLHLSAILKGGFRNGHYDIGIKEGGIGSSGLTQEKKNPGKIFASFATFMGDQDGYEDAFLAKDGSFFVDQVDAQGITARFDLVLEEFGGEGASIRSRRIRINGKFSHPFKKGAPGSEDNYQCSTALKPIILTDYPDTFYSNVPPRNATDCQKVRGRLADMYVAQGAYQEKGILETVVGSNPPGKYRTSDSDLYQNLVSDRIVQLYDERRARLGLPAVDRKKSNYMERASMFTDTSSCKINPIRSRGAEKDVPLIIWDAEYAHEKVHEKNCASANSKKLDAFTESLQDARYNQKEELAAYPAGIQVLEDWILENCSP